MYTLAGTPTTAAALVNGPPAPPLGIGSLELKTVSNGEKVFAFNFDHLGTKLADRESISYNTYRSIGSAQQAAAVNVVIDFNGPDAAGALVSGEWQDWTATRSGLWWSAKAINGQCAGATDACDKTWAEIVANNPDATVLGGVGVN